MMHEDEPVRPKTTHELGAVLDDISIDELQRRIELLETEITRLRETIDFKSKSRVAADGFFKS